MTQLGLISWLATFSRALANVVEQDKGSQDFNVNHSLWETAEDERNVVLQGTTKNQDLTVVN